MQISWVRPKKLRMISLRRWSEIAKSTTEVHLKGKLLYLFELTASAHLIHGSLLPSHQKTPFCCYSMQKPSRQTAGGGDRSRDNNKTPVSSNMCFNQASRVTKNRNVIFIKGICFPILSRSLPILKLVSRSFIFHTIFGDLTK